MSVPPKVAVQWLALLCRVRVVIISKFGLETGNPYFSWVSSDTPNKFRGRTLKQTTVAFFNATSFYHFTSIRCYITYEDEKRTSS
jgi:hypothetical protein